MTAHGGGPRPGEEAATTAGRRARAGRGRTTRPAVRDPERASILRALAGIRRQVADLSRSLTEDRPCLEVLHRSSTIRAELRAMRRRVLLLHARREMEEALPGEQHAETRRHLLALLASSRRGIIPPAETREPSRSGNPTGGSR